MRGSEQLRPSRVLLAQAARRSSAVAELGVVSRTLNVPSILRFTVVLFLLSVGCAAQEAAPKPIDAAAAVRIAEAFVRSNGYTDAPPTKRIEELDGESMERFPREKWPAMRRGRLWPRAYGYKRGARQHDDGWTVVFRYKAEVMGKELFGQAVQMDQFGEKVIMLHSGEPLKGCTKVFLKK